MTTGRDMFKVFFFSGSHFASDVPSGSGLTQLSPHCSIYRPIVRPSIYVYMRTFHAVKRGALPGQVKTLRYSSEARQSMQWSIAIFG